MIPISSPFGPKNPKKYGAFEKGSPIMSKCRFVLVPPQVLPKICVSCNYTLCIVYDYDFYIYIFTLCEYVYVYKNIICKNTMSLCVYIYIYDIQ